MKIQKEKTRFGASFLFGGGALCRWGCKKYDNGISISIDFFPLCCIIETEERYAAVLQICRNLQNDRRDAALCRRTGCRIHKYNFIPMHSKMCSRGVAGRCSGRPAPKLERTYSIWSCAHEETSRRETAGLKGRHCRSLNLREGRRVPRTAKRRSDCKSEYFAIFSRAWTSVCAWQDASVAPGQSMPRGEQVGNTNSSFQRIGVFCFPGAWRAPRRRERQKDRRRF